MNKCQSDDRGNMWAVSWRINLIALGREESDEYINLYERINMHNTKWLSTWTPKTKSFKNDNRVQLFKYIKIICSN